MAQFSTELEALNWYEGQERVLTPKYVDTIPWDDVANHELKAEFIPVLVYMRDVEKFTEVFYKELRLTPTGRDPIIRRFMEKWSVEENLHGELINRFLIEAGIPASDKWYEEAKENIPVSYRISSKVSSLVSNCFGKDFSAVHMTWGAINELTTLSGYRRLWELAKHPVLEYLLKAIAREEATHSFFYWSLARMKLERSNKAQELTKFIVNRFWTPVGEGIKTKNESHYVLQTLFNGLEGVKAMDTYVNRRIAELPGLADMRRITEYVAAATNASPTGVQG